ncbi:MAG: helix-hairpin-helix domain-containing protein [Cyclobacteriaceae bacterium]
MKLWAKTALIFVCVGFLTLRSVAQTQSEIDLEDFAENLFQVQDEDVSYEDIYESLLIYFTNPINLNKTTSEELASLYILSPYQLTNFFDHVEKNGALISINELQAIDGFDLGTIRSLLPFVSVEERLDSRSLWQRIKEERNNYVLLRYTRTLEKQEGYRDREGSSYAGDPNTLYGRYRISRSHDFSFGFTFEKDAGESFSWSEKTKGFDYYSFHLALMDKGKFKSINLGDYQMQFGQGLVFGAGFGSGKGAETVNTVKRNSTGIRPYASVLESGFFRGASTTVELGNTEITAFYSNLNQDASLQNDSTYSNFEEFVNSIQSTGFHRTENEIAAKNKINEQSFGGAVQYNVNPRTKFGATFLNTYYSRPLQKKPNNYNQFEFKGDHNYIGSIYASYVWQNFILFGEAAQSKSGGNGMVGGFMASLSPTIDMSMALRNYEKDFHSFYGNAFSESSRIINEKGVYWGLKIHPNRRHTLALYYDKFSFPWLRFRTESPSEGHEYLARYTFKPTRSITMYGQFRHENKQITESIDESNLNRLFTGSKKNYLINIDYKVGRSLSLKTRLQTSSYELKNEKTTGYALMQDLNFSFWKMKVSTRAAIFDTDYANRQYAYEKNVLYAFSIPAYNGVGSRSYILLQYNATRKLTFWARYARFNYRDTDTIGSGLTEISSNTRSTVNIMARIKL